MKMLATMDAGGPFLLDSVTPSGISTGSTVNDWNPGLTGACIVRVNFVGAGATASITGMAAGSNGQVVYLINTGVLTDLFILSNNTGSLAANRFNMSQTIVLSRGGSGQGFWYDGTATRWKPLSSNNFGRSNEYAIGTVGSTASVNWTDNGAHQSLQLTSATACTISFVSAGAGIYVLRTISPASGTVPAITWPSGTKWASATKPVQAITLGRSNVQRFYCDGASYWGDAIVNAA